MTLIFSARIVVYLAQLPPVLAEKIKRASLLDNRRYRTTPVKLTPQFSTTRKRVSMINTLFVGYPFLFRAVQISNQVFVF